jgi:hypothetical protein
MPIENQLLESKFFINLAKLKFMQFIKLLFSFNTLIFIILSLFILILKSN